MQNTDAMLAFYRGLGFDVVEGKLACSVYIGENMINFHRPATWRNASFTLRAPAAQPPCGDLCLVWDGKMTPDLREAVADLEHPEETVVQELMAERLARDIYSNAQLQEVMTDFWLNHFNIYLRKNQHTPYYLVGYERDTIRPHALGKFEDLLEAVAHSPAMMIYLDNAASMVLDSVAAERCETNAVRLIDLTSGKRRRD